MTVHVFDPLVLLRRLGDGYHHVEQEHQREPASRAATRHRLGEQMREIEARFERALAAWVPDEGLRRSWRDFLHRRQPAPDAPHLALPPLFKGSIVAEPGLPA